MGEEGRRGSESGRGRSCTVGLFVLLILSHGFEAGGSGEEFVREVPLVVGLVGLRAVLAVDVIVGLRGVVWGLC